MPGAGVEPAHRERLEILSLLRLPVSPSRRRWARGLWGRCGGACKSGRDVGHPGGGPEVDLTGALGSTRGGLIPGPDPGSANEYYVYLRVPDLLKVGTCPTRSRSNRPRRSDSASALSASALSRSPSSPVRSGLQACALRRRAPQSRLRRHTDRSRRPRAPETRAPSSVPHHGDLATKERLLGGLGALAPRGHVRTMRVLFDVRRGELGGSARWCEGGASRGSCSRAASRSGRALARGPRPGTRRRRETAGWCPTVGGGDLAVSALSAVAQRVRGA